MALARRYMSLLVAPCCSIAEATTAQLRCSVVMGSQDFGRPESRHEPPAVVSAETALRPNNDSGQALISLLSSNSF